MDSKRITVRAKEPNPLFKMWLREWIDDAEKKKKKISKTYQKALDSLNKYPLTLFSGHDCAILENIGPKICQLLDEKLEKHLNEQQDLDQRLCFKDKISELQRRETVKVSDLVRSIEAACLTDISFAPATLNVIEEDDIEMHDEFLQIDLSNKDIVIDDYEQENVAPDVEIPTELLSSSAESDDIESEDSIDRLLQKYDPEVAKKRKKLKKTENLIKRQKKVRPPDIIDLSQSPPLSPKALAVNSPVSTSISAGTKFKRFRTFDNGKSQFAGPSYASSPISKFLDVETTSMSPASPVPTSKYDDDEFDRLAAKYDFVSPIPVTSKEKSPVKLKRKQSNKKLATINEIPAPTTLASNSAPTQVDNHATQSVQEESAEDKFQYLPIDDINPRDFEVILLVDTQETTGNRNLASDEVLKKLEDSNVRHEVRKLNVGDFLWIAQHKTDKSKEYALPYIVERKRLDDLSGSIKDGRFHEQKFRLKQCGITNVVYLIESHMKNGKIQCGLPFTTLLQAATNTQIHSKFQVKFTENNQHTILYLTVMTSFIENIFMNKAPIKYQLLEFKKFNQSAVKQRKCTVRETFIKQLLALKGLSVDIALEITKNYATPTDLYTKYSVLGRADGEALLSKLTMGELKRKIPTTVSKTIYHFYMRDKL